MDVHLANICRTQAVFVTIHVKVLSVFFSDSLSPAWLVGDQVHVVWTVSPGVFVD